MNAAATRYDCYRDRWNGGRAGMPVLQRYVVIAREGASFEERRVPGWYTKAQAAVLVAHLNAGGVV